MTSTIALIERPDRHPSFWNEYTAPKSNVSWLVQMPLHYINGYSLADAYTRDLRAARNAMGEKE